MRKKLALGLAACMMVTSFAGCGTGSASISDESAPTDGTSGEAVNFTIWHDCDTAITDAVQEQVNEELADDNITVTFEAKSDFTDTMKLYGNDPVNGPDMFMHAHDSLGTFAQMGILAPIDDYVSQDTLDGLFDMTVEAGQYEGSQYLMPLYYESLVFIVNNDLWEGDIPKTTDDLYDYMVAHTDEAAGTYAVVNQHSTAYNVAPFINGFGGYILSNDGKPGLNLDETKEAITYNKKFAALEADGDYNTITTLFNEGKAAAIIGGPWLTSGIEEAGINYSVYSLADMTLPNGNALAPYAGVYSVGVLNNAIQDQAKEAALPKVLEALASTELGVKLAKTCGCAPANKAAYDDEEVASNQMLLAIEKTAETAEPMPNIPEMSVLWGPAESLLAAVNKSGEDVDKACQEYEEQAEQAIADMQ